MNEDNQMKVTVEVVVTNGLDLRFTRKLFPNADETEEIVWPAGPVVKGTEPPVLLGQPRIMGRVRWLPCCDLRGRVFRAEFSSVPEARRICRLLPETVAWRIRAEVTLDEAQLEALAEHHSRQLMLVELDREIAKGLESVDVDTYQYHRQRLDNLKAVLSEDRVNAIFSEMRGLYDPVTGERPMNPEDLRLVAGFRPAPTDEEQAKVDLSLFEDDAFPVPPKSETIH
jgi:hypothetical protein